MPAFGLSGQGGLAAVLLTAILWSFPPMAMAAASQVSGDFSGRVSTRLRVETGENAKTRLGGSAGLTWTGDSGAYVTLGLGDVTFDEHLLAEGSVLFGHGLTLDETLALDSAVAVYRYLGPDGGRYGYEEFSLIGIASALDADGVLDGFAAVIVSPNFLDGLGPSFYGQLGAIWTVADVPGLSAQLALGYLNLPDADLQDWDIGLSLQFDLDDWSLAVDAGSADRRTSFGTVTVRLTWRY